jgi:predicted hotdog family 3-hydroxylacyl-ACP dehydratase
MASGNTIIETDELLTLIPHKGKMVLLSRVLEWDTDQWTLKGVYDITEEGLFYDPLLGGIPGWVSFECMAQSVSALTGIRICLAGQGPKMGFILSISNMEVNIPVLSAGTAVRTEVVLDYRVEDIFVFDCRVFSGEAVAAAAKMTVKEVDDEFFRKQGMESKGYYERKR